MKTETDAIHCTEQWTRNARIYSHTWMWFFWLDIVHKCQSNNNTTASQNQKKVVEEEKRKKKCFSLLHTKYIKIFRQNGNNLSFSLWPSGNRSVFKSFYMHALLSMAFQQTNLLHPFTGQQKNWGAKSVCVCASKRKREKKTITTVDEEEEWCKTDFIHSG